jgi:hypothetical protein
MSAKLLDLILPLMGLLFIVSLVMTATGGDETPAPVVIAGEVDSTLVFKLYSEIDSLKQVALAAKPVHVEEKIPVFITKRDTIYRDVVKILDEVVEADTFAVVTVDNEALSFSCRVHPRCNLRVWQDSLGVSYYKAGFMVDVDQVRYQVFPVVTIKNEISRVSLYALAGVTGRTYLKEHEDMITEDIDVEGVVGLGVLFNEKHYLQVSGNGSRLDLVAGVKVFAW